MTHEIEFISWILNFGLTLRCGVSNGMIENKVMILLLMSIVFFLSYHPNVQA